MYILGIIGNPGSECHDSSAALIKDGLVVAAAEQLIVLIKKESVLMTWIM